MNKTMKKVTTGTEEKGESDEVAVEWLTDPEVDQAEVVEVEDVWAQELSRVEINQVRVAFQGQSKLGTIHLGLMPLGRLISKWVSTNTILHQMGICILTVFHFSMCMLLENWGDNFTPEDWDNEEYTGSLADSKVFTPSGGIETSVVAPEPLQDSSNQEILMSNTPQDYHQSSQLPPVSCVSGSMFFFPANTSRENHS